MVLLKDVVYLDGSYWYLEVAHEVITPSQGAILFFSGKNQERIESLSKVCVLQIMTILFRCAPTIDG